MTISIRARLTLWFCLVFYSGVILFGISVYVILRSTITGVVDKELLSRADGVANYLDEHVTRIPMPRVQQGLVVHYALQPTLLAIQHPTGDLLFCGSNVDSMICKTGPVVGPRSFSTAGQLRILSATHFVEGVPYRIHVATDLGFRVAVMHRFSNWLLCLATIALGASTLGGYWFSSRALKPVRGIIDAVHAIGEKNLSMRLPIPNTGDEIQTLSQTLNGMLARIEKAFRQVTEITANASHELRTPIAIIRTAAEVALLNAQPTVSSHRQALVQISKEAQKNTQLLDNMLTLARTDSGAQTLNFTRLSLRNSVDRAAGACRHLAEMKQIALSYTEEFTGIELSADPSQLNRLWLALLDNAIKYTPAGGRVKLRISRDSHAAPYCEISDNGIGIPPGDLAAIFERFYRAENARENTNVGSGLGLEIARWIAEVHNANIDVKSVLDAGSIFRVTFTEDAVPISQEKTSDRGNDVRALSVSSRRSIQPA